MPDPSHTVGPVTLERRAEHYTMALDMLRATRRTVHVFSRRLDGKLYDTREFAETVARLASRQPRVRFRILLQEIDPLIKYGHRLIELARRLTTAIEIRAVHPDYRHYNEAFMVFDERRIIHRTLADRYEGIANDNDPDLARKLVNFFTEVWEVSQVDPNLRRLHL